MSLRTSIFALLIAVSGLGYAADGPMTPVPTERPYVTTPAPPPNVAPLPEKTPFTQDDLDKLVKQTNFVMGDETTGWCSATLISLKYKLVLTNDHCVADLITQITKDDTSEGEVKSKTFEVWHDGTLKQKNYKDFKSVGSSSLQAEIAAHLDKNDLALLIIKADTIPQTEAAQVGGSDYKVRRGDGVFVVGNPFMMDGNLTKGIISSTTRTITWEDGTDIDYYGVDAGVNPGNSGGALYESSDGVFIGVPGAGIRGATGLGFAIPLPTIQKFLKANCYEDVYDSKGETHDACVDRKLSEMNKARDKKGLPPLKELPESHMRADGSRPVMQDKTGLLPNTKLLGPVFER
jgi:S1-C subfamily serine protease